MDLPDIGASTPPPIKPHLFPFPYIIPLFLGPCCFPLPILPICPTFLFLILSGEDENMN